MARVIHVVVLRLKSETSAEQVDALFQSLEALRTKIPGIVDFTWGPYSSPEGLNQGFTHGFVTTFADEASRNGYLVHPEHDMVKALIIPHLEGGLSGVIAFDWVASS